MTESVVLGCPRCGDQTLWGHNSGKAWCRLCGHTWPLYACNDPEAAWIREQGENPRYGPGNPDWEHDHDREEQT